MGSNAKYYAKWVFGAIVLGIVLDNWTGSNALAGTLSKGFNSGVGALKANPAAASQKAA